MSIELVDSYISIGTRQVGFLKVKYYDLIIYCDLVFFRKRNKAWIRMPEYWFTQENKTCFCRWDDKKISDQFQEVMLKLVFEKHNLSHEKIAEMLMPKT